MSKPTNTDFRVYQIFKFLAVGAVLLVAYTLLATLMVWFIQPAIGMLLLYFLALPLLLLESIRMATDSTGLRWVPSGLLQFVFVVAADWLLFGLVGHLVPKIHSKLRRPKLR
jgi:hypothetical protein